MSIAQVGVVLRHLRKLVPARNDLDLPDHQLLERFATHHDDAAFATLLKRHGSMVLGVCRSVLRNWHDADDAFQATFLVLARKAGSIHRRDCVSSWLHRVAYHLAVDVQADAARRKVLEKRAVPMPSANPVLDASLRELHAVLNEELQQLPEEYQAPLILCGLEEQTVEQAARQLGWTRSTVKGRLQRGRERLRARLKRRGLELTAGVVAGVLSTGSASAHVPTTLAASTIQAAQWLATGKEPVSGMITARVAALVQGATTTMFHSKAKIATILLLALGISVTALGAVWHRAATAREPSSEPRQAARPKEKGDRPLPADKAKPEAEGIVQVRGRVLDPEGKPVEGARLYLGSRQKHPAYSLRATSDAAGRFAFSYPRPGQAKHASSANTAPLKVLAIAKDHGCAWESVGPADKELTLRLVKDMPVRGRILDADGKPIANAKLRVDGVTPLARAKRSGVAFAYTLPWQNYPLEIAKGWAGPLPGQPAVLTTGADGRFRLTGVGPDRVVCLHLEAPGIATTDLGVVSGTPVDHVTAVSRTIRGVVRDKATGKPLAGASVFIEFWGNPKWEEPRWGKTIADKEGHYELLGLAKSPNYSLRVKPAEAQLHFACCVRLQDTAGLGPLTANIELARGDVIVSGKVTDKATGKPIAGAKVEYYPVFPNDNVAKMDTGSSPRSWSTTGADGSYTLGAISGPGVIRVAGPEPDVYLRAYVSPKEIKRFYKAPVTHLSPAVGGLAMGVLTQHDERFNAMVLLEPSEKDKTLVKHMALELPHQRKGRVVGPDGQPLTGVTVMGLSPEIGTLETLKGDEFTVRGINPQAPARRLVFHHKGKNLGCLLKELPDEKSGSLTVKLQPCGSLSGRIVDQDGQPVAGFRFGVWDRQLFGGAPMVTTDKEGRFRADGLVPGMDYSIGRIANTKLRGPFRIHPGATVESGKNKDLGDIKVNDN
jgi:RNA polymerase sigma factor (sigma-70 family)